MGAAYWELKAKQRDPHRMTEAEIRRRGDEREFLAEARRRKHRADVSDRAGKALPKKNADAALLIAQGIIKPNREAVRAYRKSLEEITDLSPSQAAANRRLRKQLDRSDLPRSTDWAAVAKAGKEYAQIVKPLQAEVATCRGILSP